LDKEFPLRIEGMLTSIAAHKRPSIYPADNRLAMQVEDQPVSYFDFEDMIPEGNYGAGTVIVWDVGTWEPLSPQPVKGKIVPETDAEASEMLKNGDFKIRLHGKKLKGDFALIHMRSRRPGSKGTEWLLIKKQDDAVIKGYDIEKDDKSALTGRTMREIAGDQGSAEWESDRRESRGKVKAPWLAETLAKLDEKKTTGNSPLGAGSRTQRKKNQKSKSVAEASASNGKNSSVASVSSVVKELKGAAKRPMPTAIHPMLAISIEKPF